MAAITFSGFNNIDFNAVVTAIMQQERHNLLIGAMLVHAPSHN